MPGRNAASARPDRTAKKAAIAVAKTAPATCVSDERWTRRTAASTSATARAAPAASVTSCRQRPQRDEHHGGQGGLDEPRHPPRAVASRCRISASTVSASRRRDAGGSRVTCRHDLVGGVEDRRRAAHLGHPPAGPQEDARLDAGDAAAADPHEVDRAVAVPDLGDECGHAAARRKGHGAHGAADDGGMPWRQRGEVVATGGLGLLAQRVGLVLDGGLRQVVKPLAQAHQRTSVISGPRSNGSSECARLVLGCSRGRLRPGGAVDVAGQRQRQQLARGHRLGAADDDGRAEHLEQRGGGGLVDGGAAGEDAAQEPPRSVDTDEGRGREDGAPVGAGGRHPGAQLGPELALVLLGGAALLLDGRGDLRADLVPEPGRARGRERLQLQGRVAEDGGRGVDVLGLPGRPRGAAPCRARRASTGHRGRGGRRGPRPRRRPGPVGAVASTAGVGLVGGLRRAGSRDGLGAGSARARPRSPWIS